MKVNVIHRATVGIRKRKVAASGRKVAYVSNPNETPFDYALYSVIAGSYSEVTTGTVAPGAALNEDPIDVCLADGCYVFEAHSDAKFEGEGRWVVEAADSAGRLQQVFFLRVLRRRCVPSASASRRAARQRRCAARDTGCHDHAYVMELFDAGFNGWGFVDYSVHKHDINGHRASKYRQVP